jgi:hypothetical protein
MNAPLGSSGRRNSNWPSTNNAFRNTATYKNIWLIKYLNNRLPTGDKLLLWNCSTNNLCPRCGRPERYCCHIVRCPHPEAQAIWDKAIQDLAAWIERHHTQPDIQTIVIANLRSWYADLPPVTHTVDWPGLTAANELQNELGWNQFYDGFLIADWMAIQQAYYDYLEKRHTGRRWASQLIRRLWTTSWDLWKHRMKILRTPDNGRSLPILSLTRTLSLHCMMSAMMSAPCAHIARNFSRGREWCST